MGYLHHLLRHFLFWRFPTSVFLFSAFTLLCAAYFTFVSNVPLIIHDFYVVAILFVALALSATALGLPIQQHTLRISKREALFNILIFLFGLGLGLYQIDYFSIWLDEEVQTNLTFGWNGMGIVLEAAYSQQMPLSYFFTALSWNILGFNELALRLPSCLFIAASGPLFYRLAKRICTNQLIYSTAPFIYLISPWLIRYSQEGRGYGCLVFCGLLWLNSSFDLLTSPRERVSLTKNWLLFFSCTLFFLLSVSLQPVIFVVAFLPAAGFLSFLPGHRRTAALFGLGTILSLVIIAPLARLAQTHSQSYFYKTASLADISRSLSTILTLPSFVNSLFMGQAAFLIVAVISMPFMTTFPIKREEGTLWFGIGAFFTFLAGFLGIFSLLINYPLFVRYYLVLYPLGLLIVFGFFDRTIFYFEKEKDRYLRLVWQLMFLAALAAPQIRMLPEAYTSVRLDRWNIDYRAIYDYLRNAGLEGDLAYIIPYQSPDGWEQRGFIGSKYYYQNAKPVHLKSAWDFKPGETVTNDILNDVRTKRPRKVFLAFLQIGSAQPEFTKYCATQPGVNYISGYLYLVCDFNVNGKLGPALESFLSGLLKSIENIESAYRIFDILLHLAAQEGNGTKCKSLLAELKKADSASKRVQDLINLHEKQCLLKSNKSST